MSGKLSDPLDDMVLSETKIINTKKHVGNVSNYPTTFGTLTLRYEQEIIEKETNGKPDNENKLNFILTLNCNGNEIFNKPYDDLLEASKDFNTLLKTLKQ